MMLDFEGHPTYVYDGGRRAAPGEPALVFIHGAQNDHSVWILQSRYLAHHGWRVMAVDLPGHGRSGGEPLADIESAARWVAALIGRMNAAPAVLVGHSMGSLIALATAAAAPDLVRGIALVGTALPMPVSDALLDAADHDEPRAIEMILAWSHAGLHHPPGHPGPGFSIYNASRRLMQRQRRGTLAIDLRACNAWQGGEAAARDVAAPVLIVSGQRDQMTPARAANRLAEILGGDDSACPSLTRLTLDDCGHNQMAEQPAALLRALRDWLATLPAPERSRAA